jgi:hypothetical protein
MGLVPNLHARANGGLGRLLERVGIALADYVAAHWREPDHGIWEPRLEPRRHVHSAMMAWVAMDRARDLFGPRPAWDRAAEGVLAEIRARGVHPSRGVLTQVMDGEALDAAVLVAPMLGLPIDDAVLSRTVDAVIAELARRRTSPLDTPVSTISISSSPSRSFSASASASSSSSNSSFSSSSSSFFSFAASMSLS